MRAIGIILAGGNSERLKDLCKVRAIAAMPVVSSYRAIDFSLSNMSNSGIKKVAVITQFNSRSLQDHLSSAKWWELDRKEGGLYIFTPFLSSDNNFWFRGIADSIYQNISYLKRSHEPYVVICSGEAVYKMDYSAMLKYHKENNADATIAVLEVPMEDASRFGIMNADENDKTPAPLLSQRRRRCCSAPLRTGLSPHAYHNPGRSAGNRSGYHPRRSAPSSPCL